MDQLRRLFRKSVNLSLQVFGEELAFKRFNPGNAEGPDASWETKSINMPLFDVIMHGFTQYASRDIAPKSDAVRDALFDLIATNQNFYDSIVIGTSEKARVSARFTLWMNALHSAIGIRSNDPRAFPHSFKEELYRNEPTCSICNQRIMMAYDAAVDHKIPYSLGGSTERANGRLAHRYCNWARGNRNSLYCA